MAIGLVLKVKPGMLMQGELEAELNVKVKNSKGKLVFDYTAVGEAKKNFFASYDKKNPGEAAVIDARNIQPLIEEAYKKHLTQSRKGRQEKILV